MKRIVIVPAIAILLVACANQGGGGSVEPGSSTAGTAEGTASAPSPACAEAFAPIAEQNLSSLSELGDLQAELQPTVQDCESVADWVAGASQALGIDANPNTAAMLLQSACTDQSLSRTAICDEL
jgi:hypothetical protein